jgi:hypothetical protein
MIKQLLTLLVILCLSSWSIPGKAQLLSEDVGYLAFRAGYIGGPSKNWFNPAFEMMIGRRYQRLVYGASIGLNYYPQVRTMPFMAELQFQVFKKIQVYAIGQVGYSPAWFRGSIDDGFQTQGSVRGGTVAGWGIGFQPGKRLQFEMIYRIQKVESNSEGGWGWWWNPVEIDMEKTFRRFHWRLGWNFLN